MLVLGDVCIAEKDIIEIDAEIQSIFEKNIAVCNLEGPINYKKLFSSDDICMFNKSNICDLFESLKIKSVSLANNHIHDFGVNAISETIEYLRRNNIDYFGLGDKKNYFGKYSLIEQDNSKYAFFGFGWSVIGCKTNYKIKSRVMPLNKKTIDFLIEEVIPKMPKHIKKVVYLHWCYELEKYPQPRHRDYAKFLIDNGVDFVIGSHPHVYGPIEKYKNGIIIYNLGNFMFSDKKFLSGKLSFPKISNQNLIVDLSFNAKKNIFLIERDRNFLQLKNSYSFNDIPNFLNPPFNDFSSKEYFFWYKTWSRGKNRFLPIFSSNQNKLINFLLHAQILARMILINILTTLKIKDIAKRRDIGN
ncbi:CapA family protein [uncultured Prochlorococcus sp.]|uniref:CapA family protein n=1 Tax=uncultured Prochlorococcus sp. TaxID=159733 RepID=UPI0025857A24|nr:CapA family protein [uncultured Prochlorococcus sp.]